MTTPISPKPWSNASPFVPSGGINWVNSADDRARIKAYRLYEHIYWNVPQTFQVVQRGEDQQPIYLPTARKMIEATNRFLAVDFDFTTQAQPAREAFDNLFRRENMYSKFATQRRYGLIRGDMLWHITADPNKPPGRRISINELDPASYFPITDDDDDTKVIGCHIVTTMLDPRDISRTVVRRQTYRKRSANAPTTTPTTTNATITSELRAFEIDGWDDRTLSPDDIKRVPWNGAQSERNLPPLITSIPVYHVTNQRTPSNTFGSSELRGIETVLAAVNQTISDEELTLAMQGLGVYATDAAPPVDEAGNEMPWEIGPGRVAEVPAGHKFWRQSGVSSVAPMLDHMQFMLDETQTSIGVPNIAAGKVDVSVAESGISLRLQLAPILAKNAEKEQELLGVHDHMLYDLSTMWLPAIEGDSSATSDPAQVVVGDPLPVNRQAEIKETLDLFQAGLITTAMAQDRLVKLGYEFPANAAQQVQQEAQARAQAADPFTARIGAEFSQTSNGQVNG